MAQEDLPYWLVNVPEDQWSIECPEFLKDIGPRDREILSIPNSTFHRMSWQEVQDIIGLRAGFLELDHR